MKTNEIELKHFKLKEILSEYTEEIGDVIIDKICNLFNYPDTINLEILQNNSEDELYN